MSQLHLSFFCRRVDANEYGAILMTLGHMTLTLGPRKNPRRNVAILLRLSVVEWSQKERFCNKIGPKRFSGIWNLDSKLASKRKMP